MTTIFVNVADLDNHLHCGCDSPVKMIAQIVNVFRYFKQRYDTSFEFFIILVRLYVPFHFVIIVADRMFNLSKIVIVSVILYNSNSRFLH